jgi:secretion/DNA translocation related CpaE-like protein
MDRVLSDRIGVDVGAAQTLVISSDPVCVDELTRLCAAAAIDADVVPEPARAGGRWSHAPCVLVGEECAADIAAMRLRRRDNVVLVGRAPTAAETWRLAVQIGAADVARLPTDAGRIADRLDAASRGREPALVVGVVGSGGGAGASTVAAGLASAYARDGRRSLLVDADALGGGIELLVGCESVPGLRWPDIDVGDGRVAASALLAALPAVDGLSVLSAGPSTTSEIDGAALHSMIGAGRRACGLVVVDLPRRPDQSAFFAAAAEADVVLIVAASDIRSVAAGRQVVAAAARLSADVRVVVRTVAGRRIEPDAVAEALGVPLAGSVPTRRIVSRSADDGTGVLRGLGARRRYAGILAALRPRKGAR